MSGKFWTSATKLIARSFDNTSIIVIEFRESTILYQRYLFRTLINLSIHPSSSFHFCVIKNSPNRSIFQEKEGTYFHPANAFYRTSGREKIYRVYRWSVQHDSRVTQRSTTTTSDSSSNRVFHPERKL